MSCKHVYDDQWPWNGASNFDSGQTLKLLSCTYNVIYKLLLQLIHEVLVRLINNNICFYNCLFAETRGKLNGCASLLPFQRTLVIFVL